MILRWLPLFIALAAAASAQMAPWQPRVIQPAPSGGGSVTFDAKTATVTNVTTNTLNVANLTVGSGSNRGMALIFQWGGSSTIPAALACNWDSAGSNQAMTAISGTNSGTNGGVTGATEIFGLLAPTSGNKNLKCTWTSTGTNEAHAVAISFTGVNQGSIASAFPNGTFVSFSAPTAGPLSVTITSATGHQVLSGGSQNCVGWGAISGTTLATDGVTGPNIGVASAYASGAATVTMTEAITGTCPWIISGTDVSP